MTVYSDVKWLSTILKRWRICLFYRGWKKEGIRKCDDKSVEIMKVITDENILFIPFVLGINLKYLKLIYDNTFWPGGKCVEIGEILMKMKWKSNSINSIN